MAAVIKGEKRSLLAPGLTTYSMAPIAAADTRSQRTPASASIISCSALLLVYGRAIESDGLPGQQFEAITTDITQRL